jgi:hypothetical protein
LWRQHYIAVEADRLQVGVEGLTSLGPHSVSILLQDDVTVANLSVLVEKR